MDLPDIEIANDWLAVVNSKTGNVMAMFMRPVFHPLCEEYCHAAADVFIQELISSGVDEKHIQKIPINLVDYILAKIHQDEANLEVDNSKEAN